MFKLKKGSSNNDNFFCGSLMFINLYRYDISKISLNCNKKSLNIKPHVNFIFENECLCTMQFFFVQINIKIKFQNKI
jgi:hypothetical protein